MILSYDADVDLSSSEDKQEEVEFGTFIINSIGPWDDLCGARISAS